MNCVCGWMGSSNTRVKSTRMWPVLYHDEPANNILFSRIIPVCTDMWATTQHPSRPALPLAPWLYVVQAMIGNQYPTYEQIRCHHDTIWLGVCPPLSPCLSTPAHATSCVGSVSSCHGIPCDLVLILCENPCWYSTWYSTYWPSKNTICNDCQPELLGFLLTVVYYHHNPKYVGGRRVLRRISWLVIRYVMSSEWRGLLPIKWYYGIKSAFTCSYLLWYVK